jgi:hypothetical protein
MNPSHYLALVGAALTVSACNPFRSPFKQEPVVRVNAGDVNANTRWNAVLATPAGLAGAVQIKGVATMAPASNASNTVVSVNLSNATPGGLHPWQLHRGQCGADEGVWGSQDAYKVLKVDNSGRASGSVTVPAVMPMTGLYYVSVSASAANPETIVACGNLAPPAR